MTNLDNILKSRDITLPTKVHVVMAMVFPVVMYRWRVGLQRKLSTEELMLLKYGVGEDSWESLVLQGDTTSPSERKSVLNVHWKDSCWSWKSNSLATWCEELIHQKRPWCWERLKGRRKTGRQRMRWLNGITNSMDLSVSKLWKLVMDRKPSGVVNMVPKSQTRLSNWA